ncbi:MAG: hypothetical protein NTW60_02060, partial [Candidatus Wolfebacteria bacterium]|nr:hypothetical protein [Candidatus Wolfebacteria bacterium]
MFLKTQNSRLRQGYGGQAKLKTIAAFTLVELIIYTAIFSIVSITMTSLLVSITKVGDRTNSASEVSSQLNFVMQNIQRLVKNASNIDIQSGVSTST